MLGARLLAPGGCIIGVLYHFLFLFSLFAEIERSSGDLEKNKRWGGRERAKIVASLEGEHIKFRNCSTPCQKFGHLVPPPIPCLFKHKPSDQVTQYRR